MGRCREKETLICPLRGGIRSANNLHKRPPSAADGPAGVKMNGCERVSSSSVVVARYRRPNPLLPRTPANDSGRRLRTTISKAFDLVPSERFIRRPPPSAAAGWCSNEPQMTGRNARPTTEVHRDATFSSNPLPPCYLRRSFGTLRSRRFIRRPPSAADGPTGEEMNLAGDRQECPSYGRGSLVPYRDDPV